MIRGASRAGLAALVLGGAGGSSAQERFTLNPQFGGRPGVLSSADPSAVIAAEIAFARLAREKGQWTSFRRTADIDAVMFVPGVVNAEKWLKKQKDPPQSVTWAPDRIFVSCDASYAVSAGHAEWPDGRKGRFVTLWRRQPKGDYKWVLDWGSNGPAPKGLEEGEIDGKVADCPARRTAGDVLPPVTGETPAQSDVREWRERGERGRPPKVKYEVVRIADPPPANGQGQSRDNTLHWQWTTGPSGARTLRVTVRYNGKQETVVDDTFTTDN